HLEVGVRIDPTRHDVAAGRVEHGVTGELRADFCNDAALDLDVRLICAVGGDDGAAFDDSAHSMLSSGLFVWIGKTDRRNPVILTSALSTLAMSSSDKCPTALPIADFRTGVTLSAITCETTAKPF